jgi:light-regulated signal transduction histidine kinase (bacteriophytochrome)
MAKAAKKKSDSGQLREQLVRLQREMDTFAYTLSHDLRAPLIHIGGFVDLLLQHAGPKLDERSRHYLQRIAESTYHMGRMVDDVLALSRLSRAEMHLMRLELKDLIKEVMNDVRGLTENRNIRWEIGELPAVVADPTLLRVAFDNLVSNAIKFTRRRPEAVISISSERVDGDHRDS